MRLFRVALACALLVPGVPPVSAGAWLMPDGVGFASSTTRLTWPQDNALLGWRQPEGRYDTLYFEYGLGRRLTAGADLGRSISGGGKMLAFLRLPLKDDGALRASAELGLGRIDGAQALRPGLSLGLGGAQGWLNADLLFEMRGDAGTDYKLDLTLGLRLPRKLRMILQLQTGVQQGDPPFARFAPSLVVPLHPRIQAEVGASWGLSGDASAGLLLGLWTEF
ncbi:hypothetical protein [Salipiger mangrovisoli]|uniref:MetA-pathway of phenol degradation n=1 Tax=Salipiger mangrovisoli TaxID=2865933 RepID=A0ABR9WZD9_9RHOB|nr:hypothetical protein [Salipiger mangrovisoli]MBE9636605.1 hypothetical protein [Salipiger mangrovisoli]